MALEVQTIIINKSIARSRATAMAIARKHISRIYTSRETNDSYRFRQFDPAQAVKGTYATKSLGNGITIILAERRHR